MAIVNPDPSEIADAVLQVGSVLLGETLELLAEVAPDLNLTHVRALTVLERSGPLRLADVASALDVTPTTVTRVADRLADAHLVDRRRQADDRREVTLVISGAGSRILAEMHARRRALLDERLATASATDLHATLRVLAQLATSTPASELTEATA